MSVVVAERVIDCRASRAEMYGRLIDTARLNRAIGNPHLEATPIEGAGGARFLIRGKLGGVPVTYEEHPFEWEQDRFFSFYRVLRGGPGRTVRTRYDFADEGSGSRVSVRVEATPRLLLAWLGRTHAHARVAPRPAAMALLRQVGAPNPQATGRPRALGRGGALGARRRPSFGAPDETCPR
jgi:hypothetical protein